MIDLGGYIAPGDGVWWGQGGAEPEPLVDALVEQIPSIGPVTAFVGLTWNTTVTKDPPAELTVVSYGGLGGLRDLSKRGRLEVLPCHYSAIPRMFATGQLPCDVGLLQVSPPDEHGLVSLGIGVEYIADAIEHTPVLIAEVNRRMPRTRGTAEIPLERFAAIIETDRPLRESPSRPGDAVDTAIAGRVAGLIDDGDTLQIGVGSLPDAVLSRLDEHRDLGFHTGMIADGVLDLVDAGAVTGAKKERDTGLVVTGAAIGSEALYRRLNDYPIEFRSAGYTHAPSVLSEFKSFVSINAAIEVDLLAQVGAEVIGGAHIGAVGGQVDFSRAAALTGGRSIIALRSQFRGRSSINLRLSGGVVTTARSDVDVIVTEHGTAQLTGCAVPERARRLIAVAAPEHRERLERELNESEIAS